MSAHSSNSADGGMLCPSATVIETFTGRFVDLQAPDPATLHLTDIARGLALTCRYGGQIERFYSVAEHSVLVHDLLEWLGASRELRVAGLFHDAAEAYLGDVVSPLKYSLRAMAPDGTGPFVYDLLSYRMDVAVAARYGVSLDALEADLVREADMWALRIEARALTASGGKHWRWLGQLPNDGELPAGVGWHAGRRPWPGPAWLDRVDRYGISEPDQPVNNDDGWECV